MAQLTQKEIEEFLTQIKDGWNVIENQKIFREFRFSDYKHTIDFVNKVAQLAEEEGHHPDLHVFYGKVVVELWTHAVRGLTENDFILASKIDTA
jgi:4a-hydroxytetrahydrobiopterin dehydratase